MREEGVAAMSMHGVARRVGIKAPSLYTYFESKHALYDELFRIGMREYRARLDQVEQDAGPGLDALDAFVHESLRFADEHPELFQLLFERPVPGFEPSTEAMEEAAGLLSDTDSRVRRMMASGVIRTELDVEQARDVIVVLVQGLMSLKRANEPGVRAGEGRTGRVLPHIVGLLKTAWNPGAEDPSKEQGK